MSTASRSIGSWSFPSIIFVTTSGLPTVSSNPSRRIVSTNTASCNSPRPWKIHESGRSDGSTFIETLPINSFSSRSFTIRAVSLLPSRPVRGEVLIPIVAERLGSSIRITGSGCGSSSSANVSPIVTSGIPATAIISPGPASLASTLSSPSVTYSSVIFAFAIEPSTRQCEII